jgi:hypothetical protein
MAEIMPLVLASHGLEIPDEFMSKWPAMTGTPECFGQMILSIEATRNRT